MREHFKQLLSQSNNQMQLEEGKAKFLETWGTIGSAWGIPPTMALIHALLLISDKPLNADEIVEELQISRGGAHTNLKELINWRLIYKKMKPGDRHDYFVAEKDMWEVIKRIIDERRQKELEPVLKVLDEVSQVEENSKESEEFVKMVREIRMFSNKADAILDQLIKADNDWFLGSFLKMIR